MSQELPEDDGMQCVAPPPSRNHPHDAGGMQGALVALRSRLYSAVELEGLEGLRRSVRDEIAYIEETLADYSDLKLVELPDYTETKKQIGVQE
jgi:hypothetical protein